MVQEEYLMNRRRLFHLLGVLFGMMLILSIAATPVSASDWRCDGHEEKTVYGCELVDFYAYTYARDEHRQSCWPFACVWGDWFLDSKVLVEANSVECGYEEPVPPAPVYVRPFAPGAVLKLNSQMCGTESRPGTYDLYEHVGNYLWSWTAVEGQSDFPYEEIFLSIPKTRVFLRFTPAGATESVPVEICNPVDVEGLMGWAERGVKNSIEFIAP